MRPLHLALILSLLSPASALAQDQTQPMLEMAKKLRVQAEQMRGQLPAEEIADMLKQADEIEEGARAGGFNAPPPPAPGVAQKIADAHNGRLEWLRPEAACAGYDRENYTTYRLTTGDRDAQRDVLCRKAYAHWAEYFRLSVNGAGSAASDGPLAAYDKAAQAAVDFYEGR